MDFSEVSGCEMRLLLLTGSSDEMSRALLEVEGVTRAGSSSYSHTTAEGSRP